jgi:G3E family GTPase
VDEYFRVRKLVAFPNVVEGIEPIALTVIGGFLGAGKTTLLNRVLSQNHGVRYAVLVNDFGSLAIDGDLVTEHGGDTVSFANGCVCCTLGDSMLDAVDQLLLSPSPPEQFLVEASGVADPRGIADLATLHPGLLRDLSVVLVDAETVRSRADDARLKDTFERQLQSADLLVINRCDLVDEPQLNATEQWLTDRTQVRCIRTANANLPLELLHASPVTRDRSTQHVAHLPDELFWTLTIPMAVPVNADRVRRTLLARTPDLLRAKGFVRAMEAPGELFVVQLAGRQVTIQPTGTTSDQEQPEKSLVLIGLGDAPDPHALAEALGQR